MNSSSIAKNIDEILDGDKQQMDKHAARVAHVYNAFLDYLDSHSVEGDAHKESIAAQLTTAYFSAGRYQN